MLATNTTPKDRNASHAAGTWTYISRCTSPWLASGGTTNRARAVVTASPTADAQPSTRWAPRVPVRASSRVRMVIADVSVLDRERLQSAQVVDEVRALPRGQVQSERAVVVRDHGLQAGEAAVVVEAALGVRAQALERAGAVHVRGRPVGLEVVDADVARGVQVEPRLGEQGRHVARRAL